jgi:hypothetical protein
MDCDPGLCDSGEELGEAQESEVKPTGEAGFLLLSITTLREIGLGAIYDL